MNLIHLASGNYPVSLRQVRQANPDVSFPVDPTDDDLAPYGYANALPSPAPADTRELRAEELSPEQDAAGIWRQTWRLRVATTEELVAWDVAHAPPPDWTSFKTGALNSTTLNTILARAFQSCPVAAGALAPALLRAEANDADDFSASWATIVRTCNVPADVIAVFVEVATDCRLPSEFIKALDPERELVRARDADGRFVADDPTTPENEAWVPAP